jgi:hypothetical protein
MLHFLSWPAHLCPRNIGRFISFEKLISIRREGLDSYIFIFQFGAASENNRSPLGFNLFWWLQEGISAYYNRVGKQKFLGCWMWPEHPSDIRTWRRCLHSRTSSDSTAVYPLWKTCSTYISSGELHYLFLLFWADCPFVAFLSYRNTLKDNNGFHD